MSIRSERKEEHLALAQMFFNKQKNNSFDQMHLLRPALPEQAVNLNSIQTKMFGKKIAAPFFINAMTGGSKLSQKINRSLGQIAAQENIALALGSASILVKEPNQLESFYVAREENPDGVVIANLNPATPVKDAKEIITDLQADALQIHLNTIQEIAMPEGDRDFRWLDNLISLRQAIEIPIVVKEVGFGLDQTTIHILKRQGFEWFDIAGSGGTDFAQIENSRNDHDVSYLEELGLSTVVSALMAKQEKVNFIVSGGVRTPLDILKGLVLGARYVGLSNTFLHILQTQNQDTLQQTIHSWKYDLSALIAVFGKNKLDELNHITAYYDLELQNQIKQLIHKNE